MTLPTSAASRAIAVVGNVNLDLKTSPIPASDRLLADGETSVEEIYESLGGGGANLAVAAARLGGAVHLCAAVGNDELGAKIAQALRRFGVTPHLRPKPVATGRSINLNWDNSQRHFLSSLPHTRLLQADDVDFAELSGCRHLFRADIWFAEGMLEAGNGQVLRRARDLGMTTSLDINWDPLWSAAGSAQRVSVRQRQVLEILPLVDYVHGNERELAIFTGQADVRAACRMLTDRGAGAVVCHRGAAGSAIFSAGTGWCQVPATPVQRIVCQTGTGDVFSAAFLLLDDLPPAERLMECGRIAARHLEGAADYIPRL
jgi:sugar/nucleoside kinase (ribokinase family)